MNAMSTRRVSSTRSACSPTAAWVSPRTRPPSRCRVTVGMADSRAAIGTELVTTTRSRSAGSRAATRAVVVPASNSTLPPAEREELGGGAGDGVLVIGAGGLAFVDAGLDDVQRADRHGAAVHPAQHAGPVQHGEVAAHRLGGDGVGLGQFGHRGAAPATSPARRSPADVPPGTRRSVLCGICVAWMDVDICCFTPVRVDLSRYLL